MKTKNTDKSTTPKRVRVCLDERHGFGHVERTDPRRLDHESHVADLKALERQCPTRTNR